MQIESLLWAFHRAINQGRASPQTSSKLGSDTDICHYLHNLRQKALKVGYKALLSKNFLQQSCSAINYLSNSINILTGGEPVPIKFWPKGTDSRQEGYAFHVSHTERCAVGDSRASCTS